jgi:succinoglycan biosynthesis transport protein ExoP
MISGRLVRIFVSRIGLVLTLLVVTLGTTALGSMLSPKRYLASTVMLIDIPSRDPVLGGAVYLQGTIRGYLASQVELIGSDRVVGKVIDELGLEDEPLLLRQWAAETEGEWPLRGWIHDHLVQGLQVEPEREAAVIKLSFEGLDPALSARIANGFAKAYVDATLALTTEPARNYASQFEAQVEEYREQLSEARQRLWEFQQQSGIMSADESSDLERVRLQELAARLAQAEAAAADSALRVATMRSAGQEAMPEALSSPALAGLRTEIGRLQGRLEEQSSRLGPQHPEILALRADLGELRQRYGGELGRVSASIVAMAELDRQRAERAQAALEAQKAEVLRLEQKRNELGGLLRAVEEAEKSVALMSQRSNETDLEARMRLSNVSILSGASVPVTPSRPKPLLNLVVGGAVGLLLGLVAAITLEKVQRPIRDPEDLLRASGVPILAVLAHADSRRPQRLIGNAGSSLTPWPQLGAE